MEPAQQHHFVRVGWLIDSGGCPYAYSHKCLSDYQLKLHNSTNRLALKILPQFGFLLLNPVQVVEMGQ